MFIPCQAVSRGIQCLQNIVPRYSFVTSSSLRHLQFSLPDQLASNVTELLNQEILGGTKFCPAIRVGHEANYYQVQLWRFQFFCDLLVVLGIRMIPKSSTFLSCNSSPYDRTLTATLLFLKSFQNLLACSTNNTQCA